MVQIIPNWHPILVHFTVALWTFAVVMHLIVAVYPEGSIKQQMAIVARWDLWLGTGFGIVTVFAGWLASGSVAHDELSHAAMMEHKQLALITLAIFALLTGWSIWTQRTKQAPGKLFLLPLVIGAGLLMSTAWHGGELVYRYGLGVMSLPQSGNENHDHDSHAHPLISSDEEFSSMPLAHSEPGDHAHSNAADEHETQQDEVSESLKVDGDSTEDNHVHNHNHNHGH